MYSLLSTNIPVVPDKPYILLLHLVSVAVQCTVKVGHTVSGCKTAEDTGVMDGLHPHFSLGYDAVMPDISIPYLWSSSNICITFWLRSGMKTSGAPRISSPPELRRNESGATSP
ncbi:hypothetical protein EMCRGX_G021559 [Ephydatia muelleri]